MVRPSKPKSAVKLVTAIRLKPATKTALKKAAEADGRSMMNLMERVLEDWLKEKGFLK
jgi:hypothetical protein